MPMTYVSQKVTQLKVTFSTAEDEQIEVFLTENYGWDLTIPDRKKITIKDMIDICTLLYSEGIVGDSETLTVQLKGADKIYVRGRSRITSAFIEAISVEPSDGTKK